MKTLEQIQKENRKMILEAIHGLSYEQALEKELGFGCEILSKTYNHKITIGKLYESEKDTIKELYHIIGKPLTLDRVLLALGKQKWWKFAYPLVLGFDGAFCEVWHSEMGVHFSEKFNWDLTRTLEEQSEETQRAIHKLLGGENDR